VRVVFDANVRVAVLAFPGGKVDQAWRE